MNGSASTPSSVTMNGTRLSIKPEMNATSRERRQSFATTTGTFAFRAFASASASFGRRSSGPLAALHLHKLANHLAPLGGGKSGDGIALGFDS
jgi:hypothetical protein